MTDQQLIDRFEVLASLVSATDPTNAVARQSREITLLRKDMAEIKDHLKRTSVISESSGQINDASQVPRWTLHCDGLDVHHFSATGDEYCLRRIG